MLGRNGAHKTSIRKLPLSSTFKPAICGGARLGALAALLRQQATAAARGCRCSPRHDRHRRRCLRAPRTGALRVVRSTTASAPSSRMVAALLARRVVAMRRTPANFASCKWDGDHSIAVLGAKKTKCDSNHSLAYWDMRQISASAATGPARGSKEIDMSNTTEIEAVLFKRVGDHYVYQSPNPWIFGRKKQYLVTEAQKAELMKLIAARRPKLRITLITAGVLFWLAAATVIASTLSPHENPTGLDALAIAALVLIPGYLACVAALYKQQSRIRPIVADAPLTDERITRSELRKAMTKAMSLRKTLLLAVTWAFTCGTQVWILVIRN
jgi:hypothetical protein